MFQREALWIDFSGSEECAIKISVGGASLLERWFLPAKYITCILGINAITGQPRDEAPPSEIQDYVVVPRQRWLVKSGSMASVPRLELFARYFPPSFKVR